MEEGKGDEHVHHDHGRKGEWERFSGLTMVGAEKRSMKPCVTWEKTSGLSFAPFTKGPRALKWVHFSRKPNENPIEACLPVFAVLVDFSSKYARESLRKRPPGITPRPGIAHTYIVDT